VLEEGSTLEKMAAHYKIKEIEKDNKKANAISL